jgi:hypothetical protein
MGLLPQFKFAARNNWLRTVVLLTYCAVSKDMWYIESRRVQAFTNNHFEVAVESYKTDVRDANFFFVIGK